VATNIKEYLPPRTRVLFQLFKEKKGGHRVRLQPGDVWMPELIRAGATATTELPPLDPDDPALMLFTGGTTGRPKAALGTHLALVQSAMQAYAWFRPALEDWDDVVVLAMPMFHVYGNVGIFASSLIGHLPLAVVPNPRDRGDLLRTIRSTHAAFFPAVPALLNALLEHPAVRSRKADLSSLKLCISGSAPLLAESRRRFEALTGGRIVDAYSITESMNAAVIAPVGRPPRPGAIGLPLPDVELRIVELDGDRELGPGEDGDILMRAPQLMEGYWGRPEETAAMIVDGWLRTGDVGHLDDDGFLHIADRRKDMIKPGGFAVWPREVEDALAAHPAVVEVGVAGVPDPQHGEAVKAWVVLAPGERATASELQAWARERLAAYKVPKHIEFRRELPRSHVGKVLRRELTEDPTGPRVGSRTVNGTTLAVEERGAGTEAILFAHGVLLDRRMFDAQVQALADKYRCIAFDSRGHGASDVPETGYDMDSLTDDAATLIRELGCGPVHFVGHSMGAFVGLRLAARHPDLVRSLVLIAPSADRQPRLDVAKYRLLQVMARRVGIRPLAGSLTKTLFGATFRADPNRNAEHEEWRRRLAAMSLPGALRAVDGVLTRAAIRDELRRITAPTLVVMGEEDVAAPRYLAQRVASGIAGARWIDIPAAGHVSPVEQPATVSDAIRAFLADGARSAAG
jgi:long-chain acyl-CoA synthetase